MFSLLQGLYLLPPGIGPPLRALVPFSTASPIGLPVLPTEMTPSSLLRCTVDLFTAPIVLAWTHEQLRYHLESKIYRVIRRITIKPDMPDALSERAAKKDDMDGSTIPGLNVTRLPSNSNRRWGAVMLLIEEFTQELDLPLRWWKRLRDMATRVRNDQPELSDEEEKLLKLRAVQLQREYLTAAGWPSDRMSQRRQDEIQRGAVRRAWQERGLSVPINLNWDEWLVTHTPSSTAVTATPDPADLFEIQTTEGVYPPSDSRRRSSLDWGPVRVTQADIATALDDQFVPHSPDLYRRPIAAELPQTFLSETDGMTTEEDRPLISDWSEHRAARGDLRRAEIALNTTSTRPVCTSNLEYPDVEAANSTNDLEEIPRPLPGTITST